MIEQVLKPCGNDLMRDDLLKHATSLKDELPPPFLDGIKVDNSLVDDCASTICRFPASMARTGNPSVT